MVVAVGVDVVVGVDVAVAVAVAGHSNTPSRENQMAAFGFSLFIPPREPFW